MITESVPSPVGILSSRDDQFYVAMQSPPLAMVLLIHPLVLVTVITALLPELPPPLPPPPPANGPKGPHSTTLFPSKYSSPLSKNALSNFVSSFIVSSSIFLLMESTEVAVSADSFSALVAFSNACAASVSASLLMAAICLRFYSISARPSSTACAAPCVVASKRITSANASSASCAAWTTSAELSKISAA